MTSFVLFPAVAVAKSGSVSGIVGLVRTETKQIMLRRTNESACAGAVLGKYEGCEAAHHGDGALRRLAFHQVCHSGDLVDDGSLGADEGTPVRIAATSQFEGRADARRTDRDVGLPFTPRTAEGVGDDDPERETESLDQGSADRTRGPIGVDRKQQNRPVGCVARIDTGSGKHQTIAILDDSCRAADMGTTRHRADRFIGDGLLPVGRKNTPALGLRDDLARDRQHITLLDNTGDDIADGRLKVVSGVDFANALNGEGGQLNRIHGRLLSECGTSSKDADHYRTRSPVCRCNSNRPYDV